MRYPFLRNNDFVLIDYLPGSSGQLLMRLWSELDSRIGLDNQRIISSTAIGSHPSTREIEYDILIPKRLTNWFLDRCHPTELVDYLDYFEFLGTTLVALSQKWKRGENSQKFYPNGDYDLTGYRRLYGIHTWDKAVPFEQMSADGYGIRCISIVPRTDRGLRYQFNRCTLCYPDDLVKWQMDIDRFNAKDAMQSVDFCTMLVDRDTDGIIDWLRQMIGSDIRGDKIQRAAEILDTYYREIVDPLEEWNV